ncbi:hypothetical protein BC834DRAFT_865386 [Gloeopeniophorella convolvens]|nr:hypothetical protein BC834DRAFT_865386 [Gloeopeniophorella convolvens]
MVFCPARRPLGLGKFHSKRPPGTPPIIVARSAPRPVLQSAADSPISVRKPCATELSAKSAQPIDNHKSSSNLHFDERQRGRGEGQTAVQKKKQGVERFWYTASSRYRARKHNGREGIKGATKNKRDGDKRAACKKPYQSMRASRNNKKRTVFNTKDCARQGKVSVRAISCRPRFSSVNVFTLAVILCDLFVHRNVPKVGRNWSSRTPVSELCQEARVRV